MDIHLGPGVITLVLAMLGNSMAFVWAAAKLSTAVKRLETFADKRGAQIDDHQTRITVLEDWRGGQ